MADTAALIEVYRRAQQRIIEAILSSKSVAFNAAMLRTINAELARLQGRTVRWVESQIPEAYREGMRSVNKAYEKAYKAAGEVGPKNYPTEFSKINRRAIQVLVDNTKADFDNALGFVGRQIKDDLRQANLQAIADKLASGTTIEKTRKILAEKYASQGLAAIKYKRAGRDVYMSLEAYAGLVARSTTAEATNTACRNQVEEFGDDLVQMTKHANACPLCISRSKPTRTYPGMPTGGRCSLAFTAKRTQPTRAATIFARSFMASTKTIRMCWMSITPGSRWRLPNRSWPGGLLSGW